MFTHDKILNLVIFTANQGPDARFEITVSEPVNGP
jgi:hypothetical protein